MKIGNQFIARPLRQDPLYQCAESLMASRDIPLEDHLVLRENLASYLSQMDPQILADQKQLEADSGRWGHKLRREIDHPYSDEEVFQHLDHLEASCKLLASSIYPKGQWYISGSIPKGRFGANSDVDLSCDGGFHPGQIETLNRLPGWEAGKYKSEFQSGDPNLIHGSVHKGEDLSAVLVTGGLLARKLSEYDSVVPLELQAVESQHGFLRDLFVQGLQRKGYQLSLEEGIQITAPDMAPERLPERSWTRT